MATINTTNSGSSNSTTTATITSIDPSSSTSSIQSENPFANNGLSPTPNAIASQSTTTTTTKTTEISTTTSPPTPTNNNAPPKVTSLPFSESTRSQLAITNIISSPKETLSGSSTKATNELQIIATQPPRRFEGITTTNEGEQAIPVLSPTLSSIAASNLMKERAQYLPPFRGGDQNYTTPPLAQSDSVGFGHSYSHHSHLYHPYYHPVHGIGHRNKDDSETNTHNTPSINTPSPSTNTTITPHRINEILKGDNISEISSEYNRTHQEVSNAPMITDRSENSDSEGESSNNENAVATTSNASNLNIVPSPKSGQTYVDITEYLNCAQSEAAKKLGIPTSTLSKRWKEAVRGRKWPYRTVAKLDKEIMTLLHNIPQGPSAPPLPDDVEQLLSQLLRRRQEELKPVVIRL
eukprot:TRINITY_DN4350_c0_g1_i2.p1 TRINITY_DN4350_c0_g1~~TRINITY_DN4350_c0_g1_i2.p1  ORF type:complete len:408 (-),score=105.45 TRINITY_DN4350_c0_g1_i2:115-1338(-)